MDRSNHLHDSRGTRKLSLMSTATMGDQVAEWNIDVQQFFNDDWPKLRELIMSLEECNWNENMAQSDTETTGPSSTERALPETNATPGESVTEDRAEIEASEDPLSDLASRINRRLSAAIGTKK